GANLLSIINDILDFSKIESGRMEIASREYWLRSLLNDVINIIRMRLLEKDVRLITNIDGSLPCRLEGDEIRVRQVLLNILSNAVKYTLDGSVSFSARGEVRGRDSEILMMFEVADTGIGIKEENLGRLFGDFVRFDSDTDKNIEGTGLGLAITKKLCLAMGGDVSVSSVFGEGSVFTATLLQKVKDPKTLVETDEMIHDSHETPDARIDFTAPEARVLIVDDIKTNLKVVEGLLAPYKMDVLSCQSGKEALEFVGKGSFDIVFMDHMMPEMDGIKATAAVRAMEGEYFKTLPIIALTANAVSGMREMFLENGFNDFLSKPIEVSKLNEIVGRWIPKEKRVNTARDPRTSPSPAETDLNIEGLDTSHGLASTGGTPEGYMEVLEIYCLDVDKRLETLSIVPDSIRLGLFTTQVHALKSASASIGAFEISRLAAELEKAGVVGDTEFIRAHLDAFLKELTAVTERIKTAISKKQAISPCGERQIMGESLNLLKNALASEDIGDVDRILASLSEEPLDEASKDCLSRISDLVLVGEFGEALKIAESLDRDERDAIQNI
ncbi:MAG: response regulator, partial [Synergistaceae bacterium]|nr:response regulator [Synergistaceae bacterium]